MAKTKVAVIVGVVVVAVLIVAAILIITSLKKLNSYEVGLKYNTLWKDLHDEYNSEGLYAGPPGFEFIKFPSVFKTLAFTLLTCLNKDGVPITLDVSFQYKARAQHLREIVLLFRDHDKYVEVLRSVGMTAIHQACSLYNTSQFQAERGKFQESVGATLASRYDPLFCDVLEMQVSNIARPGDYEQAIQDKEAAKENIKVAENERPRKITEAETTKREAETQALITVAQAQSQARIIVNRALSAAAAILNEYETEALTYQQLMSGDGLGLSDEGFISYLGIRTISQAKNEVYIGMKAPAKTSYV